MKIKPNFWTLRNEAGEGGEGGGAAVVDDPAAAGGDGSDAGGADTGSALGGGNDAPAWSLESLPEKFKVLNDDGTPNLEAILRKVDEQRSNLEKRFGSGDVRPKDYTGYVAPELPEELAGVELNTEEFAKEAHELGLTPKQYDAVMKRYYAELPKLVQGQVQATAAEATESLRGLWKDDYQPNIQAAFSAAKRISESIDVPLQEVEQAIGNNPIAIRILAAVGREMSEDKTPSSAASSVPAGFDVNVAMSSEAYQDPKHPEHEKVTRQVNAHFDKTTPKE